MANVVKEPRHAERLHHESFARHLVATRAQLLGERAVELSRPESRLMHDPEAVREATVFSGREDPACTLQLADATQPLQPRRIKEVLLRRIFCEVAERRRTLWGEALGEFNVAMDRIADQVDRLEARRFASAAAHALV